MSAAEDAEGMDRSLTGYIQRYPAALREQVRLRRERVHDGRDSLPVAGVQLAAWNLLYVVYALTNAVGGGGA